MKTIATLLAILLTLNTNAQTTSNPEKFTIEFMGIKIDGPIEACAQKFVAKGFTIKKREKSYYTLSGPLKSQTVELYLACTPVSKITCKASIYLPERISWFSIKSDYDDLKQTLTSKYGEPSNDYHFFSSPYEDGDGYETTAVKVEKCHYATIWSEPAGVGTTGYDILLQISKWMQVTLQYENAKNMEQLNKEEKQLDDKTF